MKYDVVVGHLFMRTKVLFYFETRKEIGEKFQKKLLGEVLVGIERRHTPFSPYFFCARWRVYIKSFTLSIP